MESNNDSYNPCCTTNSNLYLFGEDNKNKVSSERKIGSGQGLYDPIYGHITLESNVWKIIDTPVFQRLRKLKQLGTNNYIFPGATHTRFEHCIGVGYLANTLVKRLFHPENNDIELSNNFPEQANEQKYYIDATTIAGLCHDLGHGPFSHTFEGVIHALDKNSDWSHELASVKLLEYLIDKNHIEFLEKDQEQLITRLITGDMSRGKDLTYPWIFQIVNNRTNSIDVDKFDYICRDTFHIGLHSASVDYNRIFSSARVIDNNICFHVKNDLSINSLFHSRFKLHKQVYKHKKNMCIDSMIRDALIKSNKYFNFLEKIQLPEEFLTLDDSIIRVIKNFPNDDDEEVANDSNLLSATNILKNLEKRDIYKFVGELLIPVDTEFSSNLVDFLSFNNPKDQYYLTETDIELLEYYIDYGNKEKNPFDSILFYKSESPVVSFPKHIYKTSLSIPEVFREKYMLVICKNKDKLERSKELFRHYYETLKKQWNCHEIKKEYLEHKSVREYGCLETTPEKRNGRLRVMQNMSTEDKNVDDKL